MNERLRIFLSVIATCFILCSSAMGVSIIPDVIGNTVNESQHLTADYFTIGLYFVGVYILIKSIGLFVDMTFAKIFKTTKDCATCQVWDKIEVITKRQSVLREDVLPVIQKDVAVIKSTTEDIKKMIEAMRNSKEH